MQDKETSGKRLGEILVDKGFVTPTQVSRVLAEQHELPFVDLVRETIDMGRLEVRELAFDRDRDGDVLVFDPTRVVDGIELSADPILSARSDAYAESVFRRSGVRRDA